MAFSRALHLPTPTAHHYPPHSRYLPRALPIPAAHKTIKGPSRSRCLPVGATLAALNGDGRVLSVVVHR